MVRKHFRLPVILLASLTFLGLIGRATGGDPPEPARIKASDPDAFDSFGRRAVAIWGNVALIGAFWDDQNGFDSGAAYTFKLENQKWEQTQKLFSSDGVSGDEFGGRVALDGDALLITGLQHVDENAPGTSAVYAFRNNGASWAEIQELLASDGAFGDGFGVSVVISGSIAVIGAPVHEHEEGSGSGAAYVFQFDPGTSEWIEEAELTASDPTFGDAFGQFVGISGDVIVAGAHGHDGVDPESPVRNSGAADVFRGHEQNGVWEEEP